MAHWPQHPTEPRFAAITPPPDGPFSFMLSNEIDGALRRERFTLATEWCRTEFGEPGKGLWSDHPLLLMMSFDRLDLATHFRMRWG